MSLWDDERQPNDTGDLFKYYYERNGVAYMIPRERRINDEVRDSDLDKLSTWDLDQFAEYNSIDTYLVNEVPKDYYDD